MTTGQYIRRAAGYFIKLLVLVVLLYLLMFVTGTARVSAGFFITELFVTPRGIALVAALAVLSAFYPKFGYVSRTVDADIEADHEAVVNAFRAAGYTLVKEVPGEWMAFRAISVFRRLWLTFDDKVTVKASGEGVVIEGNRREAVHAQFRINTYLQNKGNGKEN